MFLKYTKAKSFKLKLVKVVENNTNTAIVLENHCAQVWICLNSEMGKFSFKWLCVYLQFGPNLLNSIQKSAKVIIVEILSYSSLLQSEIILWWKHELHGVIVFSSQGDWQNTLYFGNTFRPPIAMWWLF